MKLLEKSLLPPTSLRACAVYTASPTLRTPVRSDSVRHPEKRFPSSPAWAVVLLAAGMMQRDGLLVLLGHCMTLASWAFIALCWLLGVEGIDKLLDVFRP